MNMLDWTWDELDDEPYLDLDTKIKYEVKCECGSEKCKIPHSEWCPVYQH